MFNLIIVYVFCYICDKIVLLFICRMDENSRFNLEIRIVAPNCRDSWYGLDKVVDADFTNFKDFVDEVVDIYPPSFGHIVRVFYFRMDTKTNIQVCSDQDLVEMFAKHKASKCCYLTFCYYSPASEPPELHGMLVLTSQLKPHSPLQYHVLA